MADTDLLQELEDAVHTCTEQLGEIEALLQQDPSSAEALELKQELSASLQQLQAQLHAQRQQPPAAQPGEAPPLPTAAPHLLPRAAGATKMHPENIYCGQEPDFAALAARFPYLAPHVTVLPSGRGALDFTSWDATCQLTRALLEADYGVGWQLPAGQLVPPLPNRLNYIHWIHSLLQLSSPPGPVRGLDIGCGANFIYCLLGAAVYGWHMVGVDVTAVALAAAAANRQANPQLQHLLEVRSSLPAPAAAAAGGAAGGGEGEAEQQDGQGQGILLPAMASDSERFHFCMCNPPFFTSIREANQNPGTACGGTAEEMVCKGGEMAFVQQMIRDSQALGPRIHWFSSMLGKKATLKQLRKELHALGVTALRTTELAQGKTSRWAIAWSFSVDPNLASKPLPQAAPASAPAAVPLPRGAPASTAAAAGGSDRGEAAGEQQEEEEEADTPTTAAAAAAEAAAEAAMELPTGTRLVRRMLWGVAAPVAEGGKLMSAMAALLGSYGATCKVNAAGWFVEARLAYQGRRGTATAAAPPPPEAAAAAAGAGDEGEAVEEQPAAKKQRLAAAAAAADAGGVDVRLKVVQAQSRKLTVTATIANTCGELEARLFMGTMGRLKEDLSLMWDID